MGNTAKSLCCCEKKMEYEEEEVNLRSSYPALSNKYLKIESKYNFLAFMPFWEYSSLLCKYNHSNATVSYETEMNEYLSFTSDNFNKVFEETDLQCFIEYKLVKSEYLYVKLGKDDTLFTIFRDFLLFSYKGLNQILKKYCKNHQYELKRYHALALGLVYCGGRNREKINFLFNTFKDDDDKLKQSEKLNEFLKVMFLIPSYCLAFARKKMGEKYELFGEIKKELLSAIIDAFEMRDVERLVNIYNTTLFEKGSLNKEEFVNCFKMKDIGWLLSPSGIRFALEENNDDEGTDLKKLKEKTKKVMTKWMPKILSGHKKDEKKGNNSQEKKSLSTQNSEEKPLDSSKDPTSKQ